MKAKIELDIDKYLMKKDEHYYLEIDRMGIIWIVHDKKDSTNSKHFTIASDNDLKDWGIEKFELKF